MPPTKAEQEDAERQRRKNNDAATEAHRQKQALQKAGVNTQAELDKKNQAEQAEKDRNAQRAASAEKRRQNESRIAVDNFEAAISDICKRVKQLRQAPPGDPTRNAGDKDSVGLIPGGSANPLRVKRTTLSASEYRVGESRSTELKLRIPALPDGPIFIHLAPTD